MKTKAVYVVTSDEKDYFLEQVILSAYSLKIKNPSMNVILVTDKNTESTFKGDRHRIYDYVDDIVAVEIPSEFNRMQRSRYLKTSLRTLVKGNILYIDTDTIVSDSLDEVDNFSFDIGAVLDRHVPIHLHSGKIQIQHYAKKIGWDIPSTDKYFNGGFIYVKDNELAHEFYRTWHELWINCIKNNYISIDQPSLAKANAIMGYPINELDGIYNCQIIENGLKYLYNAKVIHYFASNMGKWDCPYIFRDDNLYLHVKKNGITPEIEELVANAKSAFHDKTLILAGNMCDAYSSTLSGLARRLFIHLPKINRYLDLIYNKLSS